MKGVQDALRRLEGVTTVEVDLQSNRVRIRSAPDVELDLAAIPAAVRRAGFTPADMHLVARGTLRLAEEGGEFRIHGWASALAVRRAPGLAAGEQTLRARVDFDGPDLVLEPEGTQ